MPNTKDHSVQKLLSRHTHTHWNDCSNWTTTMVGNEDTLRSPSPQAPADLLRHVL